MFLDERLLPFSLTDDSGWHHLGAGSVDVPGQDQVVSDMAMRDLLDSFVHPWPHAVVILVPFPGPVFSLTLSLSLSQSIIKPGDSCSAEGATGDVRAAEKGKDVRRKA